MEELEGMDRRQEVDRAIGRMDCLERERETGRKRIGGIEGRKTERKEAWG